MIKAVIFDMDGTLLNSLPDLKNSVNAAMEATGYPVHTMGEVRSFVGYGIPRLMPFRMEYRKMYTKRPAVYFMITMYSMLTMRHIPTRELWTCCIS